MADESNLSKDPNGSERPEAEKENIRNPDLQVEAPSLLSSFWWSSLYETAKSKSSAVLNSVKKDITELTETFQQDAATAFQFIKRDLTEFSETVQHDTASAVASTASLLRDKLQVDNTESVAGKAKEGITSLLENITDVFMPYQEPDEEEVVIIHNSKPLILDRWESQLHAIRVDPKTYCREPESPPELYETWLEVFDLNAHQEEISKIMVECGQVRNLYAKLVPTAVSHNEFWQRYFFRVQQLKEAEIKRAELVQRANQQLPSEDLDWGDDDDFGSPSSPCGNKEKEKLQMDDVGFHLESNRETVDNIKDVISSSSRDESINYACEEEKHLNGEILKLRQTTENKNSKNRPLESETPVEDRVSEQRSLLTSFISSSPENCSQKKDFENDPSKQTPCEPLNVDVSPDNHIVHDISNPVISEDSTGISGLNLTTKEKGDMILIATGNSGPSPPSSDSTGKDCSTEEEWEKDFDLEVSDEDLKRAEEIAKQLAQSAGIFEDQDNWEDWE